MELFLNNDIYIILSTLVCYEVYVINEYIYFILIRCIHLTFIYKRSYYIKPVLIKFKSFTIPPNKKAKRHFVMHEYIEIDFTDFCTSVFTSHSLVDFDTSTSLFDFFSESIMCVILKEITNEIINISKA